MRSSLASSWRTFAFLFSVAVPLLSCTPRGFNPKSQPENVDYTSYDTHFIGMDWRTSEDDPNAAVPAQRAAPNVVVEAVNKAWTVANKLLNTEFLMTVAGVANPMMEAGGYGAPANAANVNIRLLNLHLVHTSSIRLAADGSVSFLKPKTEQPTDKAALDLKFSTVGDAKSIDLVAFFDFRDQTTQRWHRVSFPLSHPVEFWNLGISAKAGADISPSSIAAAILKAPAPVARAFSSIVDQLGSVNFHLSFAGQRLWVVQEGIKRRLKDPQGADLDVSELAYAIARDIIQPVCRESFRKANPQVKTASECDFRATRSGILASPSEQVQELRTMKIVNCRVTNERRNMLRLSQVYALAPVPDAGKPDFLMGGSEEIKLWLFSSEKGSQKPWQRKEWLTLTNSGLPADQAKTLCGDIPAGKRCVVAELGEGGAGGGLCKMVKDATSGEEHVLSLSEKGSMPRSEAPLFPTE